MGSVQKRAKIAERQQRAEEAWALRRVREIRLAMAGRHETGFIDIVDNILAKGLSE